MIAAAVVVAQLLAAQCSGPACPNPCRECAFQPVSGDNPDLAGWRDLFTTVATRADDFDVAGGVSSIEVGPERVRESAEFPCRLLPAIGMAESSINQFCDNGLTIISFDCGFGVMQVTSGAASYPGIQSSPGRNIAAGADILAAKWNGDESFGGRFGDSDPELLESWYFATWAYNGFVYSNNPENPEHPAGRPLFNSPGSLSRGSYPYQELVWGYLAFPQEKEGEPVFAAVDVSYPEGIPNQSGLFSVDLPLPQPAHRDPCIEECPPSGCPPENLRTLILDDEDPLTAEGGFSVTGAVQTHAEGGFSDRFLSAAPTAGAPTVTATWTGTAPSSGTFDVKGFVPLDPAANEAVVVTVRGHGREQRFTLDQNVPGGRFVTLGQVVLRAGDPVVVVVDNQSSDAQRRIGLDAFSFTWAGDGSVAVGDACEGDVDCEGDALCEGGVCSDDVGEGEGDGGDGEGEGGAGEGEGEGDGGDAEGESAGEGEGELPSSVRPGGCTCASTSMSSALLLLALLAPRRRRRAVAAPARHGTLRSEG